MFLGLHGLACVEVAMSVMGVVRKRRVEFGRARVRCLLPDMELVSLEEQSRKWERLQREVKVAVAGPDARGGGGR